jgi:hypothetical protein
VSGSTYITVQVNVAIDKADKGIILYEDAPYPALSMSKFQQSGMFGQDKGTSSICGTPSGLTCIGSNAQFRYPSVCLTPAITLRRGFYYSFDQTFSTDCKTSDFYIKSINTTTSAGRLGPGDGVVNNGNHDILYWNVSSTENRVLYYISEVDQFVGSIFFLPSCDNGGTYTPAGCICSLGFFGHACEFST